MRETNGNQTETMCALTWKLARSHGWSSEVPVSDLARDAAVTDEKQARKVARNQLSDKDFIGYHKGKDEIWLDPPPTEDLLDFLTQTCGYTRLQVETTLDSYL